MSTKSTRRQVIVYLDPVEHRKLEQLRKRADYSPSMSSYAGSVLKRHIEEETRKTA